MLTPQGVDGARGFVEVGAGAVHVVVLLVLPPAGDRVAENGAGVPVGRHLIAGLKDVLHDPQALGRADVNHLQLVPAADLDKVKSSARM
nr:hypothetical protein [Pseudofrankia sp. DC12]